jgi:hypothetical protein
MGQNTLKRELQALLYMRIASPFEPKTIFFIQMNFLMSFFATYNEKFLELS